MSDAGWLYAYAIAEDGIALPEGQHGLEGAPLQVRSAAGVSVILSPISNGQVRAKRSNLAAHFDVLRRLGEAQDILPMGFGTIFDTMSDVDALLADHGDTLRTELERVRGCVEMALKLLWAGDDIFRVFVDRYPELRRARDACLARGGNHNEMMKLGQTFERLLNADRDEKLEMVMARMRPVCSDVRVETPTEERISLSIACLLQRTKTGEFDRALSVLAEIFDDNYILDVRGPNPPFSFVDVRL